MKKFKYLTLFLLIISISTILYIFFSSQKENKSHIIITVPTPPPNQNLEKQIKFSIISDIHNETEKLSEALQKAKNDNSQFVIITGDLTLEGTKEELIAVKTVLDNGKIPYYAIPGNHDTWASHKIKGNYFQDIFKEEFSSFEKCKTTTVPCPENHKTKFILLSNADYFKGYAKVESPTKGNQKTWLTNELKECPKITCLVFMHMPVNHPASTHIMGENDTIMTKQAKELEKLLVDNNIKEAFTGHIHVPEEYEMNGLKTTVIGALGLYKESINFLTR